MATYIKTLKEDNGDITYPQTKAGAVLLNNGSDLETELSQYVTAEDIASTSALTPPVQTNMIADGAVTSDKIDLTTFIERGTATITYQASPSSGGFVGVKFSRTHKTPPMVFAQDVLRTGAIGSVSVSNVTTTGFELLARTTSDAVTGTIEWIALDV